MKKHITDLHKEIIKWESQILFCKDELKVLQNLLDEIAYKNSDKEIMASLERLQNQLFRQLEVSDELIHDLKIKDRSYAELVNRNPIATDRKLAEDHSEIREKIYAFERLYAAFKSDINNFASRWM